MTSSRTFVYLSRGDTGHDRRFLNLALANGWHVWWLRCDGRIADPSTGPTGVRVVEWLGSSIALDDHNIDAFAAAFATTACALRPAVIQAGPVPTVGYVAVRAEVAPVVATSWGSDLLVDAQQGKARTRTERVLSSAASILVDCATAFQAAVECGAHSGRLVVAPWGVNLGVFDYKPPVSDSAAFRLVCLRALEPLYDHATLLRGFAEARRRQDEGPPLSLTIAGSGSQRTALDWLATHLRIEEAVTWIGEVDESAVVTCLQTHAVHIGAARSDGTSISLLQALAVGRPSILPDIPANREWIADRTTGWLFVPGDASSAAERILEAVSHRDDLTPMSLRCRQLAQERGDWNTNGRLIAAAYERASAAAT